MHPRAFPPGYPEQPGEGRLRTDRGRTRTQTPRGNMPRGLRHDEDAAQVAAAHPHSARHLQERPPSQRRRHTERTLHLRQGPHPRPTGVLGAEKASASREAGGRLARRRPGDGARQHRAGPRHPEHRGLAPRLRHPRRHGPGRSPKMDVAAAG